MKKPLLLLFLLLVSFISCDKDDSETSKTNPTLNTTAITNITQTTATSGGNVTDDGGSFVTAKGVCWSTSTKPTTDDNITENGTGTGIFISSLTGLTENTTYYVRAYATNNANTAYGNEIEFTTTATSTTPPVADFTASQTNIAEGVSINFTNTTTNSPTNWFWTFTGGTPSSSTDQNPSITYNTTGTYDVILTVTNDYGSDTEIKTGYITVTTSGSSGTVTDIDGNTYQTVIIGSQEWMQEDLRVTHYPNGDAIPHITDNTTWGDLVNNNTDDAYSFYNNDNTTDYGALYTYSAAIADDWVRDNSSTNSEGGQGICPNGWHLPTEAEWITLTDYLGGSSVAGGKMKETGTTHWHNPNTGATNSSSFTALPGGYRHGDDGTFYDIGESSYWWFGTEYGSSEAYTHRLHFKYSITLGHVIYKSTGFSVRCLRD